MGIAVDDTIHFVCCFRARQLANDRTQAIREAVEICGQAMLKTTVICSSAMLMFALSSFVPTRQFGIIMAAILVAAVIGDLVCLPALLMLQGRRMQLASVQTAMDAESDSLLVNQHRVEG